MYSCLQIKKNLFGSHLPVTRSSYEAKFCRWLDNNPNVIEWSSECIEINYFDVTSNKMRRYFPDFYMKAINKDGEEIKYIIEIKPYKETHAPRKSVKKSRRTFLTETITWKKNLSKWKSAEDWCNRHGYQFKILTERELFK